MPEGEQSVKQKLDGRSPDVADSTVYLFHAVREFHSLNAWFAQYSGPLVAYPAAVPKDDDGAAAAATGAAGSGNGNGNGHAGNGNGHQQNASGNNGGSRPATPDELLAWIHGRYGKYAGGDGAKYIPPSKKPNGQEKQPSQPPDTEIFEHGVSAGGSTGRVSVVDDREDEDDDAAWPGYGSQQQGFGF
jgi:hypothetical protein